MKSRIAITFFCLFFIGSVSGVSKTSTEAKLVVPINAECECINESITEVYSFKCWLIAKVAKRYLKKSTDLPREDIKRARDLVKDICETLLEDKDD